MVKKAKKSGAARRKKSAYGKPRKKNSQTQRNFNLAMQNNNPDDDEEEDDMPPLMESVGDDDDAPPAPAAVPVKSGGKRKARADGNWRTHRAVQARDRKLEKERKEREAERKAAQKKLDAQTKKRKAAEEKAKKATEKTEAMGEELKTEKKLRVAAEKKSQTLQLRVQDAEHQTWREKQTSRMMIAGAQEDALDEIEEAMLEMREKAAKKQAEFEAEAKADAEAKCKMAVHEERRVSSEKMNKMKAAADAKLEKECRGYEALMAHMQQKHDREKGRLTTRISDRDSEMADIREQHRSVMDELQQKLDQQAEIAHEEKQRRRRTEQKVIDATAECAEHIKEMDAWLMELAEELKGVRREAKKEKMAAQMANGVAAERMKLLDAMKANLGALTEELATAEHNLATAEGKLKAESQLRENLERLQTIRKEIKRERPLGRRGGGARWPVHVVLLICELLTVGNPPSAIPGTLQITHDAFRGCELKEVPQVDFVRKCRSVLENMNLMLAAKRLGEAESWHQLFTDGTSRRQIAFQNLVIGLLDSNDKFDSVIASSCIILEDESAVKQVESIKSKIVDMQNMLQCWRDVTEREFPELLLGW